ncbi:MAG: polymer-forming cytoskeletal protein [Prosthecobacter sp.]|nr:polymer-forming cytoskeletal protein [Prosthecobacter sp.]
MFDSRAAIAEAGPTQLRVPMVMEAETVVLESGPMVTQTETWSPELLASLDWLRIGELARAIAEHHGCELAQSCVLSDGAVMFGMLEQPRSGSPQRALVKVANWNNWGPSAEKVTEFGREVQMAGNARGIFIAPGGFSPAALMAAQEYRIETVDAAALHRVLMTLPPERSDFFYAIATSGHFTTPSCPVCLEKLKRVEFATQGPPPERTFTQSGLIADHVNCGVIEVAAGCEVTFLHEVRAQEIRIAGHACGDFVCEGQVILEPGGTLTGTVAARSVDVRDGGELRGQFRILEGALQPFSTSAPRWHWRCENPRRPACAGIVFEPHDALKK